MKIITRRINLIATSLIIVLLLFLFFATLFLNYKYISHSSSESIYTELEGNKNMPNVELALLLGTPKHLPSGRVNNYYKNRITATVELYKNNKISKILISADKNNKYQENEIDLIKLDLIKEGVLEKDLLFDYNGFRTWNSIQKLKEVIDSNTIVNDSISKQSVLIISQKFHLERAIYLAKKAGIKNCIGFAAKGGMSNQLLIREILARVKMQLDLLTYYLEN